MKMAIMLKVFVLLMFLGTAGNLYGYGLYWQGPENGDWASAGNWALEWAGTLYSNYTYEDNLAANVLNGSSVINSGVKTVSDFMMATNHGEISFGGNVASAATSEDITLTINNGATLHSTSNFDLGYYSGSGAVIVNVEQGGSIITDGYFLGSRSGLHTINLAGNIEVGGNFGISGATIIDFASTGSLVIAGDWKYYFDAYWSGTVVLDRGVGNTDPGWGTTYGIIADYDSGTNTTTVTSIPEPATICLLLIGGLAIKRRK
ncbi:MAG: hypothetical protein A2Y10_16070 [Planctomycetes bacterium GWF2_41_51]|nr:MAG: hypothetical protein A2Y10_16070 [Planctomycetes bacterium GWF2_41_51]HBG25654.1 hypothetical protein [Phycisphaerales bacterium]